MRLAFAAAAPVLTAFGCTAPPSPADTDPSTPPANVAVSAVHAADLPLRVEAGGIVQARSTALVTSRVTAPILRVHVGAGDLVRQGQPLVTLDAREVTANRERAAATLTSAAGMQRAAESRVEVAEANLRLATATFDRINALHEKRSATTQELDQAVAARAAAEAQVQSGRAESAAAAAAHEAARAASEAAEVSRSYAVLTAPFDGVVAARMADPGSLASPGAGLIVIEEAGPKRLEVRLDDSRSAWIAVGQSAEVRLDADANDAWTSTKVVEVGRTDPGSHSFLVKLALPDTGARTGSFGRARFAGPGRRTLVVESSSVFRRAGLSFVFAVDADQRARLRPVVTGAVDGDVTEVGSTIR
jgi:RND family efflux transporter MFP subunit